MLYQKELLFQDEPPGVIPGGFTTPSDIKTEKINHNSQFHRTELAPGNGYVYHCLRFVQGCVQLEGDPGIYVAVALLEMLGHRS